MMSLYHTWECYRISIGSGAPSSPTQKLLPSSKRSRKSFKSYWNVYYNFQNFYNIGNDGLRLPSSQEWFGFQSDFILTYFSYLSYLNWILLYFLNIIVRNIGIRVCLTPAQLIWSWPLATHLIRTCMILAFGHVTYKSQSDWALAISFLYNLKKKTEVWRRFRCYSLKAPRSSFHWETWKQERRYEDRNSK